MPGYGVSPGNACGFCRGSRKPGNRMSRRIVNITLDNLGDLPPKCRKCVFWELDPVSRARAEESGDLELEKESWVSSVLLEWGSCGKIAYVDGVPAGYMLFAPPQYVPRSIAFPTSPVSADAVLFMTAHLLSEFAGGGIGRMLVQAMAKDLTRRGVRAIEAFGDRRWESPACVLPVDYLLAVGFKTAPAPPLPAAPDGAQDRAELAGGCRGGAGAAARVHDAVDPPGCAAARITGASHDPEGSLLDPFGVNRIRCIRPAREEEPTSAWPRRSA